MKAKKKERKKAKKKERKKKKKERRQEMAHKNNERNKGCRRCSVDYNPKHTVYTFTNLNWNLNCDMLKR